MKAFVRSAVAAAVLVTGIPAQARVQPQMYCWLPDVEFPVACEEEDEEDGKDRGLRAAGQSDPDAPAAFRLGPG